MKNKVGLVLKMISMVIRVCLMVRKEFSFLRSILMVSLIGRDVVFVYKYVVYILSCKMLEMILEN